MPPPSSATNGAPEDSASTPGSAGQNRRRGLALSLDTPSLNTDTNPGHPPNVNGRGPPTPVLSATRNQDSGGPGPGTPEPVGIGAGGPSMALSPSGPMSASTGGQLSLGNPPRMSDAIFSAEFINSVARTLDEIDNSMVHRSDSDINFERDFGQWFNDPDDAKDDKVNGRDPM